MRNDHAQKIVICCAQIALLVIELLIFCEMVIVVIVVVVIRLSMMYSAFGGLPRCYTYVHST